MIYANNQAARLMGCESVDEALSAPPGELVSRFAMEHEDGRAVDPSELPGRRVLAGEPAEPLLVLSTRPAHAGSRAGSRSRPRAIPDAAGRPILAVNVFEDVTEAKRAEFRQRFLMRASEALASSVERGTTLQEVARLAVTEVSDWCSVHLVGRGDEIELAALAHVDPDKVEFARELHARYPIRADDEAGLGKVLRTGESQLIQIPDAAMIRRAARSPEHAAMIQRLDVRSVMHVPMKVADATVGAIAFVNSSGSRLFDELDLALAEEIGRRAATALENARLYEERAEVSQALQAGLLPPALPEMQGWSLGSLYRAAGEQTEVGGDFYDAFRVEDGWMVVVGDVAGRGAPAASLTALARYTIRTAGQLGRDPEQVFGLLNRTLRERGDLSLCAVVLAHLYDRDGRTGACVVCAGSPPPLRLRDGGAEEAGDLGPFLGAFDDGRWSQREIELSEGDLLVLYTDGILDAQGSEDRFGETRLRSMLKGAQGPRDVIDRVTTALDRFEVGAAARRHRLGRRHADGRAFGRGLRAPGVHGDRCAMSRRVRCRVALAGFPPLRAGKGGSHFLGRRRDDRGSHCGSAGGAGLCVVHGSAASGDRGDRRGGPRPHRRDPQRRIRAGGPLWRIRPVLMQWSARAEPGARTAWR